MKERHATGHENLTLVLGGARSGKSDHALKLAMAAAPPWIFVATAEALDAEMQERIKRHKEMRGEGCADVNRAPRRASPARCSAGDR